MTDDGLCHEAFLGADCLVPAVITIDGRPMCLQHYAAADLSDYEQDQYA